MKAVAQTSLASEARESSLALLQNTALPSIRGEAYRYFPIQGFEKRQVEDAEMFRVDPWAENEVQVSDHLISLPQSLLASEAIQVSSLAEDYWEKSTEAFEADHFYHWMGAHWAGGILIRVKAGQKISDALRVNYTLNLKQSQCFKRVIYLEKGSELSLLEYWNSSEGHQDAWLGTSLQIVCEPGAKLNWQSAERSSNEAIHIERQECWLEANSQLRMTSLPQSFRRNQCRSVFHLTGERAEVEAQVAAIGQDQQVSQWWVTAEHRAPATRSNCQFFGVAQDQSRLVFDALIDIPKGMTQVEGHQLSRSLLLSPRASVNNLPRLRIASDDVSVSHGASVSSFDENQLYYLQSRGLSPQRARQLIVDGFVEPVIEKFSFEDVQKDLRQDFRKQLKGEEDDD